jgi:hypothetical protein
MHHLWTVTELRWYIVEIVMEFAEHEGRRSKFWTTLVSLASVNRGFHQLAVNVLWTNLPSLRPILKLMPTVICAWGDGSPVRVSPRVVAIFDPLTFIG